MPVEWRVSAYDGQAHAFREIGPDFSEAICSHSVPTLKLAGHGENQGAHPCLACQLMLGDELAAEHGDPAWRFEP